MTGQRLSVKNVKFQFGDYIQATQPPKGQNTGNSMDERTSDAIYCRPSGNTQGGFFVYRIATNQLVHRNKAWSCHSSDTIAGQIEAIAINEGAPEGLVFGDRAGATTILDFETADALEFTDDISDEEYEEDADQEIDGDHELDGEIDPEVNEEIDESVNADDDMNDSDMNDDIDLEADNEHMDEETAEAGIHEPVNNGNGDAAWNDNDDIEAEIDFEYEDEAVPDHADDED